jgi:hypothetical protein
VEADQLEDSAKAYAGDCMDNPYKIDEDETSLLKVTVEEMFVIEKPSDGGNKNERSCNAANVIPGVLVPVVKCEPVGGVEAAKTLHMITALRWLMRSGYLTRMMTRTSL